MLHIHTIPFTTNTTIFQTNRSHKLSYLLNLPEVKTTNLVMMEQVHSATVTSVEYTGAMTVLQTDAVITDTPNTTLIVKTADCLPILISAPNGVIAAIHAGRKGTDQGIFQKTIEKLMTKYQVKSDIHIWFGPRICESCYQIDRETDTHYDLIEENKKQLQEMLSQEQYTLIIQEECTLCNKDTYFSYRADAPLNGRLSYSAITNSSQA